MAKFSVQLTADNAAFDPDPAPELVRIMRDIANRIERNGLSGFYETVRDINGNEVGRFAIKNDDGSNWTGERT